MEKLINEWKANILSIAQGMKMAQGWPLHIQHQAHTKNVVYIWQPLAGTAIKCVHETNRQKKQTLVQLAFNSFG